MAFEISNKLFLDLNGQLNPKLMDHSIAQNINSDVQHKNEVEDVAQRIEILSPDALNTHAEKTGYLPVNITYDQAKFSSPSIDSIVANIINIDPQIKSIGQNFAYAQEDKKHHSKVWLELEKQALALMGSKKFREAAIYLNSALASLDTRDGRNQEDLFKSLNDVEQLFLESIGIKFANLTPIQKYRENVQSVRAQCKRNLDALFSQIGFVKKKIIHLSSCKKFISIDKEDYNPYEDVKIIIQEFNKGYKNLFITIFQEAIRILSPPLLNGHYWLWVLWHAKRCALFQTLSMPFSLNLRVVMIILKN